MTTTERCIRRVLLKTTPQRGDILRWQENLLDRGKLVHRGGNVRSRISNHRFEQVRLLFQNDLQISIHRASTARKMPQTTVHLILRKSLHLLPYRIQNLCLIQQIDKQHRLQFGEYCQNHLDGYSEFLSRILFRDEWIFRLNGHVNTQSTRIWVTERPSEGNQVPVNSACIMFWCGISKEKIIGPYEVEDGAVTGESYRQLLIRKKFPHLASRCADFVFQ